MLKRLTKEIIKFLKENENIKYLKFILEKGFLFLKWFLRLLALIFHITVSPKMMRSNNKSKNFFIKPHQQNLSNNYRE